MNWQINFRVHRQKHGDEESHLQSFTVEVAPDESILDGIEKIWAHQDRSLTFRHACHHASCGTCGMRVNGVEKLTCVTTMEEVAEDGDTITVEPMRNFPLVSDLVVDMGSFFAKMEQAGFDIIREAEPTLANQRPVPVDQEGFHRYENCIECGLCLSACPIVGTDEQFLGPAALGGVRRMVEKSPGGDEKHFLALADDLEGVWRCHSALECNVVCPSNVDPGSKIMSLRRQLIWGWIREFFTGGGR